MDLIELCRYNLAVEPDLRHFLDFIFLAVNALNGNPLRTSLSAFSLFARLRASGVGTDQVVPVCLTLRGTSLLVSWGNSEEWELDTLAAPPPATAVSNLRTQLLQSTASSDPALLLKQNAALERYFQKARRRMEKELQATQQVLDKRQNELWDAIRRAETDSLTGLLNRRAYDEKLEQAFRRTIRQQGETLSLILFDLDNFKEINDQFGHQFGDEYLQRMAQAVRVCVRTGVDYAFRFGGDEFAALLFAEKSVARKRALQILARMDGKVSIGIASISQQEPGVGTLRDFIRRADNALYEAKRSGRGKVVVDTYHPMEGRISWEYFPVGCDLQAPGMPSLA